MAQPEKRYKVGACTASIFVNEIDTGNGIVQAKSVSLQRSFKDKDGQWQASSSFRLHDLPKAQLALSKAYEYLVGVEESPEQPRSEKIL